MTLADRLRQLREIAGIPLRELDRLAGLSEGHCWLIEDGQRPNLEIRTIEALAKTLGATVGWLASGEGRAPAKTKIAAAVGRARGRSSRTAGSTKACA